MSILLAVLSFPFWWLGIIFVLSPLIGKVTVNGQDAETIHKVFVFFFGMACMTIAWSLVLLAN